MELTHFIRVYCKKRFIVIDQIIGTIKSHYMNLFVVNIYWRFVIL